MGWFRQPWFRSAQFASAWWGLAVPVPQPSTGNGGITTYTEFAPSFPMDNGRRKRRRQEEDLLVVIL